MYCMYSSRDLAAVRFLRTQNFCDISTNTGVLVRPLLFNDVQFLSDSVLLGRQTLGNNKLKKPEDEEKRK